MRIGASSHRPRFSVFTLFVKVPFVCVLFAVTICAAACDPKSSAATDGGRKKITIGFSMDSFVVERWQRDRDVFMNRAKELGAEVILQIANENHETQVKQIMFLADQNVDVIVVIPNDSLRLGPVIRAVKARGIPVISYDRLIRDAGSDLFVSFDNWKIGELIAQSVVDALPSGQIVIINGSKADSNSYAYNEGFKEVLNPLFDKGSYKLVREVWLKDWSADEANLAMQEVLDSGARVDAVICANDFLAEATIKALAERKLAGKVLVTGHDAELSACQRIVEGTQLMTVYKPIPQLAGLAAESAIAIARHEDLGETISSEDGTFKVPTKVLQPIAVTKDNMMSTVIAEGFHQYDDVYRNIPAEKRPRP